MTHWGENYQGKDLVRFTNMFEFLLKNNHSFAMYVIHGGTNFGLTAGANARDRSDSYQPLLTTYDYDAPINEQGSPNKKY